MPKDKKTSKAAKVALTELHLGRFTREESDFKEKGTKNAGNTTGYVAEDKTDNKTHMVKKAKKKGFERILKSDRQDLFIEYTAAPLAERVLPGRAPKIGLITATDENHIGLRSTFFKNFQTLVELTNAKSNHYVVKLGIIRLGNDVSELPKVEGFEKVIAGALLIGERDFHGGNMGVVEDKDTDSLKAVKIDHGLSLLNIKQVWGIRDLKSLRRALKIKGYHKEALDILFSPDKFVEAVAEISHLSREEVENIISKQVYELAKHDIDSSNVARTIGAKSTKPEHIIKKMTDNVMQNKETIIEVAADILQSKWQEKPKFIDILRCKKNTQGVTGVNEHMKYNLVNAIEKKQNTSLPAALLMKTEIFYKFLKDEKLNSKDLKNAVNDIQNDISKEIEKMDNTNHSYKKAKFNKLLALDGALEEIKSAATAKSGKSTGKSR